MKISIVWAKVWPHWQHWLKLYHV